METAIRKEIHNIIDTIPEPNLHILRPLLDDFLTKDNTDDDVLSDEEIMLLDQCDRDRKEHPENFTSWEEVRKA
jgi:hypothetical protein